MASRSVMLALALFCAALGLAPSAPAKGHLDRSFGTNGIVYLAGDIGRESTLGAMAVAPDGSIYFTEEHAVCSRGGCPYTVYLKRYRASGELDRHFGRLPVAGNTSQGASMTVDPAGRPLLAWEKRGEGVVVRRFHRDGRPDRSFGDSGAVTVACGCYLASLAVTSGGRVLIGGHVEFERTEPFQGVIWVFARLRPDGERDRGFGGDGIVRLPMRGYYSAAAASGLRGFSLLSGFRCCSYLSPPFVARLSARGHLDRRFTATTAHSLRGLFAPKKDDIGWERATLILRSHGKMALFGRLYSGHGVVLGLLPSGRRDRSFGRNGVSLLPMQLIDAASDGAGNTFVTGYRHQYEVVRLRPDGSTDRRFGRVALPGAYNEEGIEIVAQGGSAIAFDRNLSICRQICPSHPKMFRVLR